jgi:hypothetical protein
MSRVPTLLTKTAFVAGVISLSVLSPDIALAQCSQADLCSSSTCSALQHNVHPACDQPRSCANVNVNNKQELVRRLLINQQCLAARQDVALCFSNPDPGHEQAIKSVENAIVTCRVKLNN